MKKVLFLFTILFFFQVSNAEEQIKIVYSDDFSPYSWNDDGPKGILIDVIEEVLAKRMNLTVVHEVLPWGRAQGYVEAGTQDAFVTFPSEARLKYTVASKESVIVSENLIYTRIDHPRLEEMKKITSLVDQLTGFEIIDYVGNGWGDTNLGQYNRYLAPSLENVFKMLASGRGDLFVGGSFISNYTIMRLGLKDKLIPLPNVLSKVPFRLCIGKKSSFTNILEKFDEEIKKMQKDGTLERIYDKYR
ncbi:MAG: transporter substrate-binding domain-containing protein [Spirochaetales bacterium]|nr:transporter substrate-binding domain-containing protein [Spirochaetales bacterium]